MVALRSSYMLNICKYFFVSLLPLEYTFQNATTMHPKWMLRQKIMGLYFVYNNVIMSIF